MRSAWTVILVSVGLVACSASGDAPPTWHADVKPLLDRSCNQCHVAGGIAPFVLTDYASARSQAQAMKVSVTERRMPPWLAGQGCTDYADDGSLTDDQIRTLARWADAGAPEGDPSTAPGAPGEVSRTGLSRVDVTLPMPMPYAPRRALADDYRCFLIDWPGTQDRFVTGFRARPGNARLVHHVIAFLVTPDKVAEYQKLDADEAGEGWTCYGAPAPGAREVGWLGAWAPGSPGNDAPAGTGIRIVPGSKVALQVHYNSAQAGEGDTDLTAVEFKVDDAVAHEAFIFPWTSPQWLGTDKMKIPADAPDTMHAFQLDPTPFMKRLTNNGIPSGSGFDIYSATLHMHTLGTTARLEILRKDDEPECMLRIDRWDFDWQNSYRFARPKRFNPGDQLRIECHWDNTASMQRYRSAPADVYWGEGTGDEMCLGILYIAQP